MPNPNPLVTLLSEEGQVLSPGAGLWVLADPKYSHRWNKTLNWYLNFLLPDSVSKPLLVKTSFYLPNHLTLILPFQKDWLEEVRQIWYDLKKPDLRIFLPFPLKKPPGGKGFENHRVQWVRD